MPATMTFRRQAELARRWPIVYQARELTLDALTGQAGTLSRATTRAIADSNGTNRTVNYHQPGFTAVGGVSALDLGASESLSFACDLKPVACCGLLDFFENGSLAGADHLFSIGANQPTATAPLIVVYSTGTQYRIDHNNASTTATCTLSGTAPTAGQRVRLRWWVYADGSVQIWQSINGAAETTASRTSANTLAAAWSSTTKYWLNAYNSNYGAMKLAGFVVGLGNQTQAKLMEALA